MNCKDADKGKFPDQQLNTIDEKIKSLLQTVEQKIQDAMMIQHINFHSLYDNVYQFYADSLDYSYNGDWSQFQVSSSVKNQFLLGCLIVLFQLQTFQAHFQNLAQVTRLLIVLLASNKTLAWDNVETKELK